MTNIITSAVSSFGKAVRSVASSVMDLNTTTFSGAVDVIVVRKNTPNGVEYDCTPFHVKFGILQVLKTSDRDVTIELNGKKTDLKMRLSNGGFAYFPLNLDIQIDSLSSDEEQKISGTDQIAKKSSNKTRSNSIDIIRKNKDKQFNTMKHSKSLPLISTNQNENRAKNDIVDIEQLIDFKEPEISLCKDRMGNVKEWPLPIAEFHTLFNEHRISYNSLRQIDLDELQKKLVALYNGRIYPFSVFAKYAMARMVFGGISEIEDFIEKSPSKTETDKSTNEMKAIPIGSGKQILSDLQKLPKSKSFYTKNHRKTAKKHSKRPEIDEKSQEKTQKTPKRNRQLKPSSNELEMLDLRPGLNLARFSVTSTLQGTQIVEAAIYLWGEEERVVITDIDGTITRSDYLGFILPNFGNNWAHRDVAKLFRRVKENGYAVLYLTARLISLSAMTREYLFGLDQNGGEQLPEGPILTVPFGWLTAYKKDHKQRPHEMKIKLLQETLKLFPNRPPFHAGFGNKETDSISYETVGVPSARIFIINPTGEIIKHNAKHSYGSISDLVEQIFPPIDHHLDLDVKFGMNYWKKTIESSSLDRSQIEGI